MWDVIVVGAGPAGCQAAWHLHRGGRRVLLVDHKDFPRYKSCGGMLSPGAVKLLPFNIMAVARGVSPWTLLRGQDGSWDGRGQKVFLTHRIELDTYFWRFVTSGGVAFRRIGGIARIKPREHYCDLHTTERELLRAVHVVAADGSNSAIRRLCCAEDHPRRAIALEADLPLRASLQTCPVGFDFSAVQDGYVWYFPKGDHLNVGVASFHAAKVDRGDFMTLLRNFLGEAAGTVRVHGAPLDTFDGHPRLGWADGRVLFAGDAAGIVDPVSGEGIFQALCSGKACAEALLGGAKDPVGAYHEALQGMLDSLAGRSVRADACYGGTEKKSAINPYD